MKNQISPEQPGVENAIADSQTACPAEQEPLFDWQHKPDVSFEQTFDEIYEAKKNSIAATVTRQDAQAVAEKPSVERGEKRPAKHRNKGKRFAFSLLALVCLYCVSVFSDLPFIAKWRTIYIETAMSTMSHKWLATAFIPQSVIDEVLLADQSLEGDQAGLCSNWNISPFSTHDLYLPWKKEKRKFEEIYSEIDQASFNAYLEKHADEVLDENGYLMIDKAGLEDGGTTIQTVYEDQVLAVDTENAITIIRVEGDGYVGRLAIVKDPSRVGLGLSNNFDEKGERVGALAESNSAVLAINASGFYDPNGEGNGSGVYGLVISNGELLNQAIGDSYKTVGFDKNNRLNVGDYPSFSTLRDAVEFKPALIVNGKIVVSGSAGWGIHPRSAIGQTKKGEVLLLIIDGRAPGYSIGCTVSEAASILQRYGAYQACNLDGGSSSLMYYNGREITKPSAADKVQGRSVPNGFVVYSR